MVARRGILFVISGPSGVGKGTLRSALLKEINDLKMSVSATTRLPREGEKNGEDYFFVSSEVFEEYIKNDRLLEWAIVYNNLYGTPRDFVLCTLEKGEDVLLEIDIQGAMQIKDRFSEGVFIFILPPNVEELSKRLCSRGKDSEESIGLRLASCEEEITHLKDYDYLVVNDQLENAVDRLRCIITAERCKIINLNLG